MSVWLSEGGANGGGDQVVNAHGTIPGAADTDAIAAVQTAAAGGLQSLTLTDSPVAFTYPRRLTATATSDCSSATIKVTYKDENGDAQTTETGCAGPDEETIELDDGGTAFWATEVSEVTVSQDCAGISIGYSEALVDIDWNFRAHTMKINEDTEFQFTNVPAATFEAGLRIYMEDGGDHTITVPSAIQWENGTAPSLSSEKDVLQVVKVGSEYYGFHAGGNMS
jgi:hypothetical protein